MTPTATFLRAFVESNFIALAKTDDKAAFPGYARANQDEQTKQYGRNITQKNTLDYGLKIARVDDIGDNTAIARICYEGIQSFDYDHYPPMLSPQNPTTRGILMFLVTFHRIGASPPSNQRGPLAGPLTNVFGGWYVTQFKPWLNDDGSPPPSPQQQCGAMPDLTQPGGSYPGWPRSGV